MNKINIPFKGMSNVPDDSFSQDGSMSVLLNMRHKGGELVQCQPPTERSAPEVMQAMFHAQSGKWIELGTEGELRWADYLNSRWAYIKEDGVKSFALMGNMVIMYYDDRVEYAVWNGMKYLMMGGLPDAPQLILDGFDVKEYTSTTDSKLTDNQDEENYHWRFQKGNIDKCLASIYKAGGYVDRAWFRIGVRLFDGSYLVLGAILELSNYPNIDDIKNSLDIGDYITSPIAGVQKLWYSEGPYPTEYKTTLKYFIPKFRVGALPNEEWSEVVAAIDVFSTGSIMSHTVSPLTDLDTGSPNPPLVDIYKCRTPQQLKDALINAEFFKVASFDTKGNLIWSVDDTSPSNLAVQDVLSEVSIHSVIPQFKTGYNSRLHIYDYKEMLYKGYSSMTSSYYGVELEERWRVFVHIKTEDGVMIVEREDDGINTTAENVGQTFRHSYYFSYPDSRAFKMEIFRVKDGKTEHLSLNLSPHPLRNEAIHVRVSTVNLEWEEYKEYDVPYIDENYQWVKNEEYPTVRNGVKKSNVLKVSAVDNPFYYPTAQTYKFEGNIVGLASNAEAISTGQFGQYPLFVFTTEGIWAMAVDASGQGAYVSQSPFSREVCSGAVCSVSGGIVFTTERGVMAISGGQVTELSQPLDGFKMEGERPLSVTIDGDRWEIEPKEDSADGNYIRIRDGLQIVLIRENYEQIPAEELVEGETVTVRIPSTRELFLGIVSLPYKPEGSDLFSAIFKRAGFSRTVYPVQIREYIKGAKLAYNYLHNEVILSNVMRGYSYVYSLTNQEWSIIDRVFDITTNSYPELVVYNNIEQKRYKFTEGNDKVPVVAITRPVKVDTLDFKRLRQAALRCTFEGSLNFYVLGSNDGASFVCITGKECPTKSEVDSGITSVSTQRDLITSMSRSKQYKYFAIAVAGQMSGRVSMAELLVDAGFANNQIR